MVSQLVQISNAKTTTNVQKTKSQPKRLNPPRNAKTSKRRAAASESLAGNTEMNWPAGWDGAKT